MSQLSKEEWIERVLSGEAVWNIGQIDDETARALNRLVKQGRAIKARGSFCGISQPKTIWCLPSTRHAVYESVKLVEANGDAADELERLQRLRTEDMAEAA